MTPKEYIGTAAIFVAIACSGSDGAQGPPGPPGPSAEDGGAPFNGGLVGEATTFNGTLVVNRAPMVNYADRVSRTAAMTGTDFVTKTNAGQNVCDALTHPCSAWEVQVLDTLSSVTPFDVQGWVAGSFTNTEGHMRSLASGQDSTLCSAGNHLSKFPSPYINGVLQSPSGLHCVADVGSLPVYCCKDR